MSTQVCWKSLLKNGLTNLKELCDELDIPLHRVDGDPLAEFPLRVPREFVARMEKGNPKDPLFLQVLPRIIEKTIYPGYSTDPLNELSATPIPGLLHKYRGRVLLMLTGGCAIHCRYCFRRHFPYENHIPNDASWEKILDYLSNDLTLSEVILSGGDPLVIKDSLLTKRIQSLESIRHLKRLRIHTRMPVLLPERITPELLSLLERIRFKTIIVIHCNHPSEISENVLSALNLLKSRGIILLNQAVLLKEINDNSDVLIALNERLFEAGVLPYYLHLLDPVQGARHFEVDEEKAKTIMSDLMKRLPGYLVPKLVREIPGVPFKIRVV